VQGFNAALLSVSRPPVCCSNALYRIQCTTIAKEGIGGERYVYSILVIQFDNSKNQ
jgi:hypothetical protein